MSIRTLFQNAAVTAVRAFGDVAVSTNYEALSSATYNASSGAAVATRETVAGVSVIFDVFKLREVDGVKVRPEDKRAYIPAKVLSTVTPSVEDRIYQSGVYWNVVSVEIDPAGALYVLQVRKS